MTGEKIPQFFAPQGNAQRLHVSKDMHYGTPAGALFEARLTKGQPISDETTKINTYDRKGTERKVTFKDGSVWTTYRGTNLDYSNYYDCTYYDANTGLTYRGATHPFDSRISDNERFMRIDDSYGYAAYDRNVDNNVDQREIYNRNELYDR